MNKTARACAPLGYSAAADAARSASNAVIRASLSFRALTSAAKSRSISSMGRRLAAADAPPPSPVLAPAAIATAASPPPAVAVAPDVKVPKVPLPRRPIIVRATGAVAQLEALVAGGVTHTSVWNVCGATALNLDVVLAAEGVRLVTELDAAATTRQQQQRS